MRRGGARRSRSVPVPAPAATLSPYPGPVRTAEIELDTSRSRVVDLTPDAASFCRGSASGLLNVFAPHATAGLALLELGSGSEEDLSELVERLLPRDHAYTHAHGSPGHGADHLLPVVVTPSLTVPVEAGRMLLGTWQSVAFIDFNRDNPRRRVRFSLLEQ
jgi:secondary thiamine-phosphate synthase enzyme